MELKMLNEIVDSMEPEKSTYARGQAENLLTRVGGAVSAAGYTICDLKPLAELLGCEPETGEIERKTHQGVVLIKALRKKIDDVRELVGCDKGEYLLGRIDDLVNRPTPPSAAWYCAQVAQALNWRRTEFDTLDELLEELRASEEAHSKFVDSAIQQNELMETVREKLQTLAELSAGRAQRQLIDELLDMTEPRKGGYIPTRAPMRVVDVMNGLPPTYNFPCSLKGYMPLTTTHTLLHAGELYREVTILLHTEQLVAWRTADGQEYSAPAHQVLLDPDEDGLAAAILSHIAGVEIAPEHMAELRAQMAGGVTHG